MRISLAAERSKNPQLRNVSLTIGLDANSQKVEVLKSCGKVDDDQRALSMLHKVLRPSPDRSLDGTEIIVRFYENPVPTIEVWHSGSWVHLN